MVTTETRYWIEIINLLSSFVTDINLAHDALYIKKKVQGLGLYVFLFLNSKSVAYANWIFISILQKEQWSTQFYLYLSNNNYVTFVYV